MTEITKDCMGFEAIIKWELHHDFVLTVKTNPDRSFYEQAVAVKHVCQVTIDSIDLATLQRNDGGILKWAVIGK